MTHRVPVLERGDQAERLERGAGVAPALNRQVELRELEGKPGRHHLDRPGPVVHHGHGAGRRAGVGLGVVGDEVVGLVGEDLLALGDVLLVRRKRKPRGEDLVCLLLQLEVDRGEHLEPTPTLTCDIVGGAAEDRLLPRLRRLAQEVELRAVEKLALDLGDDVVRLAPPQGSLDDSQWLIPGLGCLGLGDPTVLLHLADHLIAPLQRQLGATTGVVQRRVADQDGERGRLIDVELVHLLAEELLGGGLHPVGPGPEIDRVHVMLEDPLLGEAALHLGGDEGLGDLALDGHLGADEGVLHDLLGDGGSATGSVGEEVVDRGGEYG